MIHQTVEYGHFRQFKVRSTGVIKARLGTRNDDAPLINTSIHRGVGLDGGDCFNSFGVSRINQ
jgi:hypothetical protein